MSKNMPEIIQGPGGEVLIEIATGKYVYTITETIDVEFYEDLYEDLYDEDDEKNLIEYRSDE